jgi:hypothetical protein
MMYLDPDQNLSDDSGGDSETIGQVKRNYIEWQNFFKKIDTITVGGSLSM